jgi:hypothetical protein
MSKVFIWSCCEPFIGIVCACLPTYAPLVRRFWRRSGEYGHSDVGEKYASDKSHSSMGRRGKRVSSMPHGNGFRDATLRGDDEIELTVDISAQNPQKANSLGSSWKGSPKRSASESNEIRVKTDFSWYISA